MQVSWENTKVLLAKALKYYFSLHLTRALFRGSRRNMLSLEVTILNIKKILPHHIFDVEYRYFHIYFAEVARHIQYIFSLYLIQEREWCPGEQLARMELSPLFLLSAARFTFSSPAGVGAQHGLQTWGPLDVPYHINYVQWYAKKKQLTNI